MVERSDPKDLRRVPREGRLADEETEALREEGVAAPRLRGTFRESMEADEDA